MRIGELATRTGCNLETVRYYERIGLLAPPPRNASGYRSYARGDAERLRFIVRSRGLGFSLVEIRSLLTLIADHGHPCAEVDSIARAHLEQIETKQRELAEMAGELCRMIESCSPGTVDSCRIVKSLKG
jgi:MerR family mercuric resistance operon transcriptional regulator